MVVDVVVVAIGGTAVVGIVVVRPHPHHEMVAPFSPSAKTQSSEYTLTQSPSVTMFKMCDPTLY
jgi:hypothetical protein